MTVFTPEQKRYAYTKWIDGMYRFRVRVLQRQGVHEDDDTMADWRNAVHAMSEEQRSTGLA
jgi:hypothetical protein